MSFSVSVKTKFKAPSFADVMDAGTITRVQREVVDGSIKPSILVGNSPVAGFGRFLPYADPEKYPGSLKGSRPVNLKLTGKMLSYLKALRSGPRSMTIGIHSDAPAGVVDRAEGNNFGTAKGVVPRRFIPGIDERFKPGVMLALRNILSDRIGDIIEESGNGRPGKRKGYL